MRMRSFVLALAFLGVRPCIAATQLADPYLDATAGLLWSNDARAACSGGYFVIGVTGGIGRKWLAQGRVDRLRELSFNECPDPVDPTSRLRLRGSVEVGRRFDLRPVRIEPVITAGGYGAGAWWVGAATNVIVGQRFVLRPEAGSNRLWLATRLGSRRTWAPMAGLTFGVRF